MLHCTFIMRIYKYEKNRKYVQSIKIKSSLIHNAPINISPQRVGAAGIRQQNNPNPQELDRIPRHGMGNLIDTFSRSSKLNYMYITNLMAHLTVESRCPFEYH